MLNNLTHYSQQIQTFQFILLVVNILVHIFFASAVAKDSGRLVKGGIKPLMVTGMVWALATLLGGVMIAAIYWLLHHSKLTRE